MILTHDNIEQFLNSMSANNVSNHTIRAYKSDLSGLLSEVGETDLASLEAVAAGYLTGHVSDVAARTTRRRLAAIRSFSKWAGIVNPLTTYRTPTPAAPAPHPIPEGIDGVLAMANAADRSTHAALIALCGLCGLRVSEACSVRYGDIDQPTMMLHVYGKGRKERDVPISDAAWRYLSLRRVPASASWTTTLVGVSERRARQIITRLGRVALGHHVASHDLRATFATAAYAKTKDLRAVAELLGHASVEQTMVYTGVSQAAKRDAAEVTR